MRELIQLPNNYTHERLLADVLQAAHLDRNSSEMRQLVEKNDKTYRHLMYKIGPEENKYYNLRELLLTTTVESTTMLSTELNQTLIEGAQPMVCARNAFPVEPMNSESMIKTYGEATSYAPVVPQGSEIPIRTQDRTPITFTAVKHGWRPVITKEMVKYSKFPAIAQEVAWTGRCLENTLNRSVVDEFLNTLAATADYCTDFGNAGATPLLHLDEAVTKVKNNGYMPTKVMMHPTCTSAYREAIRGLYFDGIGSQVVANGAIGKVSGLDIYETGIADDAATYVWGWGTDNYIGGVVYDPAASLTIGMAEDITTEQSYNTINQLYNMSCTITYDAQCLSPKASVLLQY